MLVDCALRLGKGNRHLMNPADFPVGNLLKGAGDNSFSEDFIEGVGIVNILRSLFHTEYRNPFRKMGCGKEGIPLLVGRDWLPEIGIVLRNKRIAVSAAAVDFRAPGQHIDGIVIQKLKLRGKLRDVISRAGPRCQQLAATPPETIQTGFRGHSVCIGHFVAFVKDELYFLIVPPYPPLDLFPVLPQGIECHNDNIAAADTLKILQPLYKYIGQPVIGQHHIPVVPDGDCRGYYPGMMNTLPFHTI